MTNFEEIDGEPITGSSSRQFFCGLFEFFGLSATSQAKLIGDKPVQFNEIVFEIIEASLPILPVRLARQFSTDTRSRMNRQRRYALEIAAQGNSVALQAIRPHKKT